MTGGAGALRALLVSFGIEVEGGEKLDKVDKKLETLFGQFRRVGEIAAEAFALRELKEFVEGQIQAGAQLKVMSERLGTGVEELQALELAANEAGVETEALTTGLRFLNRNLDEARTGSGEGAKAFSELHIAIKNADGTTRAATDVLGELADKIAGIEDPAKATNVAMQLLGRGGAQLVPLLRQGGEAFRQARAEMQKLGGGMSEEFVEQAHAAEAANVRLNFAMTGLKSQIAMALFPALEKLVGWLTKGVVAAIEFAKHTTILKTGLDALAVVAGIKLAFSLSKLASTMGLLKPSILETVAAFGKFLGPIALALALYGVFDELYTLMNGGKTIIGDTLDELFGFGTAATMALYMNAVFEDSKRIFGDLGSVIEGVFVGALEQVWNILKGINAYLGDMLSGNFSQAGADVMSLGKTLSETNQRRAKQVGDAGGDLFGGKAMAAEQLHSLLGAGVSPEQLLAGQQGHQSYLTQSKEGRVRMEAYAKASKLPEGPEREKALAQATAMPMGHFYQPPEGTPTVHVPSVPRHDGPAGSAPRHSDVGSPVPPPPPVIHQTNTTTVTVDARGATSPEKVGGAVGAGVATSQQKANNNALNGVRKP